jgi:hypothetical protein
MKYEYKKEEKKLYGQKAVPTLMEIPKQKYICIKGKGNPNSDDFGLRIEVLYGLSYAIRMMPKKGFTPEGYFEYVVYPLEGIWDLTEKGRLSDVLIKEDFLYTIMIRQPAFVNDSVYERALEIAKKKKNPLLGEAYLTEIEDGLSVQMLHKGSFDNEGETFSKMKEFIKENNLKIKTLVHREIYLSDARRSKPENLKTILRYKVEIKGN